MKVIIAGSRGFNNYDLLAKTLDEMKVSITEVVCGNAKGPDTYGKIWANSRGIPVKMFYPDWRQYGKAAGMIRNHEMGDYGDYLIAFWDGESHGTKDMIDYMSKLKKNGRVILFKNE